MASTSERMYNALQANLLRKKIEVLESAHGSCKELPTQPGLSISNVGPVPLPLDAAWSFFIASTGPLFAADQAKTYAMILTTHFSFSDPAWHTALSTLKARMLCSLCIEEAHPCLSLLPLSPNGSDFVHHSNHLHAFAAVHLSCHVILNSDPLNSEFDGN